MKIKNLLLCVFLLVALIGIGSAVEQLYCCEKTTYGAWCQNEPVDKCATDFRKAPGTSCENMVWQLPNGEIDSCRLGTCINGQEGLCSPNTPQRVCKENGGYWENKVLEEISQCQLGCCFLGDQAAFVTQTRCSALSSLYGLETNYRRDIQNEVECSANANPYVKGACVYEENYVSKCKFITKRECQAIEGGVPHKGYLCSAESLGTICGPRGGTTCYNEKVYFLDTCGQLANVYDYSKINDENYWSYVVEPSESCGYERLDGNKESTTCGNCEYFFGSTCKSYRQANSVSPKYGDYICASLDCKDADFRAKYGRDPGHGERWCVTNNKKGSQNLPGTEHFVLECRNGEVEVLDECSVGDYRGKICIDDEINDVKNARCSINIWGDCVGQETEEECLDREVRDCQWIEGFSILKNDEGAERKLENLDEEDVKASCVPLYTPAFDFWQPETQAKDWCGLAESTCLVEMEINIFRRRDKALVKQEDKIKHCIRNCYCLEEYTHGDAKKETIGSEEIWRKYIEDTQEEDNYFYDYTNWISTMDQICTSLGDCGSSKNYIDKKGYFEDPVVESEFFAKPKELEKEYGS